MMFVRCQQTGSWVRDVPRGTVMAVRAYVWELMHLHLLKRTTKSVPKGRKCGARQCLRAPECLHQFECRPWFSITPSCQPSLWQPTLRGSCALPLPGTSLIPQMPVLAPTANLSHSVIVDFGCAVTSCTRYSPGPRRKPAVVAVVDNAVAGVPAHASISNTLVMKMMCRFARLVVP